MDFLLPNFPAAQVLVVGDVMLDRYWQGPTARISPEAPVPVVNIKDISNRAGGAGNVALNLATLGVHTQLLGITGTDENAATLKTLLAEKSIQTHFIEHPELPTITKLRVLSRHQQLIRLDFEESFQQVDHSALLNLFNAQLPHTHAVVLSDYGKGTLADPQPLIQAARARNLPVLIDPKGTSFEQYRGATLLTPNLSEFEAVVGRCSSEEMLYEKAQTLLQALELSALLVTRSEKGMTLFRKNQPAFHQPARTREVFDVTGAGDTVISVLAASLAAGADLVHATLLANTAAGIVVGKLGTATVSPTELNQELQPKHTRHILSTGVCSQTILQEQIALARQNGETLVMTNGCFDILHPGHVQYLKEAKALGDRLIVAVNADASVSRLKGPTRPINPLEHRMAVLAGLASVDWVVPFDEDTPAGLIEQILPHILVKGGDYTVEQIAGHEAVQANGGQVIILSFKDNCSTSAIVGKILHSQ